MTDLEHPPGPSPLRKSGRITVLELMDRVGDGNYTTDCDANCRQRSASGCSGIPALRREPTRLASVSVVHLLSGGVTRDWLIERIQE